MPLVTRTSNQGNFFQQDAEPPNWSNADLWADTNLSPRGLFINNAGTALQLGTCAIEDSGQEGTATGTTAGGVSRRIDQITTSYVVKDSVTVTPSIASNTVIIVASYCCGTPTDRTVNVEIQESGVEIGSSEVSEASGAAASFQLETIAILTDVTAEAHTYDVAAFASANNSVETFGATITAHVIQ